MHVTPRRPDDLGRIDALIRRERGALQRDRLRAVRLALEGKQTEQIVATLGRARRFVQEWVYACRGGGIEAIKVGKSSGRPTKRPREKEQEFKARMLAGPADADGGVCTLRGADAQRILEKEFGVRYTLDGVYDLMRWLRFSCLAPRPRHRKNDPQVMRRWLDDAPLLSGR
jgi:transposase